MYLDYNTAFKAFNKIVIIFVFSCRSSLSAGLIIDLWVRVRRESRATMTEKPNVVFILATDGAGYGRHFFDLV